MFKKIFNSLGSNYNWREARGLMNGEAKKTDTEAISDALKKYVRREKSEIYLFYKAREALEAGCKIIGSKQKGKWAVAVTGLTCYVVERAIRRAGAEVVFCDVGENQLNFDLKSLAAVYKKNPHIKAVVLQNTFGLQMRELEKVVNWCKQKKLVIIEDCAHNMGANYRIENGGMCGEWGIACGINGPRAGSIGEMAVMSWSQDKTFDVVSGGCLIINDTKKIDDIKTFSSLISSRLDLASREGHSLDASSGTAVVAAQSTTKKSSAIPLILLSPIAKSQIEKDRRYGIRTWWIRNWYGVGLGKWLHWQWKKRQMLSNPMQYVGDEEGELHEMTSMAKRALSEKMRSANLENEVARRRKIAMIYYQKLGAEKRWAEVTPANIQFGVPLRYPVKLKNKQQRDNLIKMLAKKGFYLSDVWYDVVVAPERYFHKSTYKKRSCPNGEKLAQVIFNLPTHKNISEKEAMKLAELVEKLV